MTLEEQDYFRQKMLDEYGPGWEEIVTDYKQQVTPRYRPATDQLSPHANYRGWNNVSVGEENFKVDPTRFRADNPLSLLSSKEDIDAVLRDPSLRTKQDYINELDRMDPDRLQGPVRPPMEMNTSGVPYWDDPETAGSKIPYPKRAFVGRPSGNPSWAQTEALYNQGQSNYYGPTGNQNRISPLPHQLEGPETATFPMMGPYHSIEGLRYDPNQELYNPNYYGTPGQMGAPPPEQINRNPGLLDEFNQINPLWNSIDSTPQIPERQEAFSQVLPPGQSTTDEDWMKQAWQKQPGLLEEQNMKESGWMKDKRMKDSQNRELDLASMFLNFGQQQSQDDYQWEPW